MTVKRSLAILVGNKNLALAGFELFRFDSRPAALAFEFDKRSGMREDSFFGFESRIEVSFCDLGIAGSSDPTGLV